MPTDSYHAPTGFRLRDFRVEDLAALTDVLNATYPDEPTTLDEQEHSERTYPQDNPRLRFVVENEAGELVGFGQCLKPFWLDGAIAGLAGRCWHGSRDSPSRKARNASMRRTAGKTSPTRSASWNAPGMPTSGCGSSRSSN
jgi:hypothetical protein